MTQTDYGEPDRRRMLKEYQKYRAYVCLYRVINTLLGAIIWAAIAYFAGMGIRGLLEYLLTK